MRSPLAAAETVPQVGLLPLDLSTDPGTCGHKAATLALLRGSGFTIPDGFVIPAGLVPDVEEIREALRRLGDGPVAVRSSGIAEDLPHASFAGQYDTVLNVVGAEAVFAAAEACVRSASNGRLRAYGQRDQPMAVLVQRMINADAAGVAFSANPLTGNRNEARVSATRGLGDALVGGLTDADEWSITTDHCRIVRQPQGAITSAVAQEVAALAKRAEVARKSPQDIEWAVAGNQVWLLQSRPITNLPVPPPAVEIPKGTWMKDAGHFAEPLSPFAVSTQLKHADTFFDEAIATWGLLPDRLRFQVIGHEPYAHVDPDDGGKNPPPWWVMALVARIVPGLRRKLGVSAKAVGAGLLDTMPTTWEQELRPKLKQDILRFAEMDLRGLDDDALFGHIEALTNFYAASLRLHFSLFIPHGVGVHELAVACKELLGWDLAKTMGLLQGLSNTSTASTDDLVAMAQRIHGSATLRDIVASGGPDGVSRLSSADPELAASLDGYFRFWGLRPIGPEAGSPTVSERPHLVTDMLRDLVDGRDQSGRHEDRLSLIAEARAQLSGPARERFDTTLACAERVYPLREDNVLYTDQLIVGLLRRSALEVGRRMVERALLRRAEDAVMLTMEELREALQSGRAAFPLVHQRTAEHAWVRANPGPMLYGPPPGASPDLRGLPTAARRINTALMWAIDHELNAPPASNSASVSGIGASPGVCRGRVRIIRTPDQLHLLRAGEILVCPTTQAAWMMVFRRAGGIVTETGSVLAHTAIVAREFGLPAVVGAAGAMDVLIDGEEVIIDGTLGTITRLDAAGVS